MGAISPNTLELNSSKRTHWVVDNQVSASEKALSPAKINVRSLNAYIKNRACISDLTNKHKVEIYDNKSALDKAENDFSKVNLINSFSDITLIPRNNYLKKSQRWKCIVVQIEGEVFKARLEDLTSDDDDSTYEIADFSTEEVSPSDLELLSIGAVFYWSVGYEMNNGQISKQSIIRFQRLVKWSEDEFDEAIDRAKTLSENLLWD